MRNSLADTRQPGRKGVRVDVIIPVHKGLSETRACIESVLSHAQRTEFELIVIDDCSPDRELSAWLGSMAEPGKFTLLRNHDNLGFVQTVNRGMELHRSNDVILLNNDAIVANDWLDRLVDCAYAESRIATVTPFSNNATICSYPKICQSNELPAGMDAAALDSIFSKVNRGQFAEIPTGVGFCIYIRRDAIDEVGLFDAESFGKGYGEENDFSQRAIRLGWKNVLAADVFVQHSGGVSFGAEQGARKSRATEVLNKLHPDYADDVSRFVVADPIRSFRLAVDLCRLAAGKLPVILAISHSRGGGTQKHIDDLAALLVGKARCLLLRPVSSDRIELAWNQPGEALSLEFDIESEYELLLETLKAAAVCRVHFHHLVEVPLKLATIARNLGVPYDFTIHDYYLVCPRIHLVCAPDSRYCGEKGEAQCNACMQKSPAFSRIDISAWRAHNARIMEGASRLLAPSADVVTRLKRYFPGCTVTLAPHPEPYVASAVPQRRRRLAAESLLRVFVLGALTKIKGADLLEACAVDAARRNLPLKFELIGYGYRELLTVPKAQLVVHGRYAEDELPRLIDYHAPDLIWFPASAPETYCYTLSAALAARLPVAVPNLGALAERVAGRPRSWVFDWRMTPVEMNDWLVALRKKHFVDESDVDAAMGGDAKSAMEFSYPEDYLHPVEKRRRDEWTHGAISALAEKLCDSQITLQLTRTVVESGRRIEGLERALAERDERIEILNRAVIERESQIGGLKQTVAERDSQVGRLSHAAAEHVSQIDNLTDAVAERDGRIGSLNHVVAERNTQIGSLNDVIAGRNARIGNFNRIVAERDRQVASLNQALGERDRRIAEILASTSWRITRPLRGAVQWSRHAVASIRHILFGAARHVFRRLPVRDDGTRLRLKTFFLLHFGPMVGRARMRRAGASSIARSGPSIAARNDRRALEDSGDITSYLMAHTGELPVDPAYPVTRFMHYVWRSRADLMRVFDLVSPDGRAAYCRWFAENGSREYGVPDEKDSGSTRQGPGKEDVNVAHPATPQELSDGVNLIGYARGEFGMGEVVRSSARSFAAAGLPFSVIDYPEMGIHGSGDDSVGHWVVKNPMHAVNIFHINADLLPSLYFRFGRDCFERRYNIGYWAWELSKCPPDFDLALNMVDEVWTISEFVCESFRTRSRVPVFNMSLAVEIPQLQRSYSKEYFGLPGDHFHFLFTFDAASHLDRKNPIAAVRAFKAAFPKGGEKAGLVLKTMNVPADDPLWHALMHEVDTDARIRVISKRLKRDEVLGLNSVCDAFVSLHRSEGFGLCLAESMLLGKPVISTNYSASRDFAREGTACIVDYKLVPVNPGAYPFWQGQEWAEPDIEHAAFLMCKLFRDEGFRVHIAQAGQRYVNENFNVEVVGNRYALRLGELKKHRFEIKSPFAGGGNASGGLPAREDDEIAGFIDLPSTGDTVVQPGAIDIAGWAVAKSGIEKIEIRCDEKLAGEARYGLSRPDVAAMLPEFHDPGRSGFSWRLDTTGLAAGPHVLTVSAQSCSGRMMDWKQSFCVPSVDAVYEQWIAKNSLTEAEQRVLCAGLGEHGPKTLISIVAMADAGTDSKMLSRTLESVKAQLYGEWELIICIDNAGAPSVEPLPDADTAGPRVSVATLSTPTWAEMFSRCRGDFIGMINVGDVLDPRTLFAVAKNTVAHPDAGLIYADEDRLENGRRVEPRFKPAWSPIYLQNHNYVGRPWFASAQLLRHVTIAGEAIDGAAEHSLLMRLGRAADKVMHVPMVLCSRKAAVSATRSDVSARALDEHEQSAGGARPPLNGKLLPKVSIVIPTCLRNVGIIDKCFSSLLMRTDYPDLEVIVVRNNVADEAGARRYLERWPFKVMAWDGPFNWSGINNAGARNAAGELLLFMNDDVEPLSPYWLTHMVAQATQAGVGAVGAMLRYPDRTIQHGGIHFVDYGGGVRHLFRSCSGAEAHIAPMVSHSRECGAVTGACMLTRRDLFESTGGFDETLPLVANDVDYCLRIAEMGFASVVAADATLVHHEGVSRAGMPDSDDMRRLWARWSERLLADNPFCNPNIDNRRDDWWLNPHVICTLNGRVRNGGQMRPPMPAANPR